MKNTFGSSIAVTLFGESHGEAIGAVIDGLAPGIKIEREFIEHRLYLRRPHGATATARVEADSFKILSGEHKGFTTGAPLCIVIENADFIDKDYENLEFIPRPSHADFAAYQKYHGYENRIGGGHFSGRITAAIVAAGAIIISALKQKGIEIGSHIKSIGNISDSEFADFTADIKVLNNKTFAVLDDNAGEAMKAEILAAKSQKDSIGGVIETAITGLPAGVGEPWFDTLEGVISHAVFSIPAVKGIEFGAGFELSEMRGSKANDQMVAEGGKISFLSNNSGGISGGISNGDTVIFRTAFKPTPTIAIEQQSVDINTMENKTLEARGRHDPCIVPRARIVVDSISAIAVADMLALRYGTDWLA